MNSVVKALAAVIFILQGSAPLNAQTIGHNGPLIRVGPVSKPVADSSSIADVVLTPPVAAFKNAATVEIKATITNKTNRSLDYGGYVIVMDIKQANGKRPPETILGCELHFFSDCFNNTPHFVAPYYWSVAPHQQKIESVNLTQEYDLSESGAYEVIGYVCNIKDVPCFKTNTIRIVIK